MKNHALKSFEISLIFKEAIPGQKDLIKSLVCSLGVKENQIIEYQKEDFIKYLIYFKSPTDARIFEQSFKSLRIKKVRLELKVLKVKDWQDLWKQGFKPIPITKRFMIIPAWEKRKFRLGRREPIYVDTSFAFGTGGHATTQMMARLIEACSGKFKSVLDIGTGTGILAILAVKYGAQSYQAIDLSREIIKVAKMNLALNHVSPQGARAANLKNYSLKRKFDLVTANLITPDLICFRKKILTYVDNGGYLAISGVSQKNYQLLRKEFDILSLRCLKVLRQDKWVALLFKKRGRSVT